MVAVALCLTVTSQASALNPQPLPPGIYAPTTGTNHALSWMPKGTPPAGVNQPEANKGPATGGTGFEPPDPCSKQANCKQ